jgi:signal transduction histidine kinase
MKLVPRLLVLGVALPILGLAIAVLVAGSLFRRSLVRDVEERLFAQAAVESVSLFDGPDRLPHVHIPKSPLAAEVVAFAPVSMLYDPDGHCVVSAALPGQPDEPAPTPPPVGKPRLDAPNANLRTLTVAVDRPGEGIYTLYLKAQLGPVDSTMAAFYRAVGGTVAGIALLLLIVLYIQARGLTRRVQDLIGFVPLLKAGPSTAPNKEHVAERQVSRSPVGASALPAQGTDELAELGAALTDAASFLHAQQAAQERFLANAAHQLRTPLAVLCTEIDLALRRPRENSELRAALERTRTEADRLTLLARKLLDFESLRVQQPDRREVDLAELVHDVVTRQAGVAKAKGVRLQTDAGVEMYNACDPVLVAQAFENLVDNAIRFAPPDTEVSLTVRREAGGACGLLVHDDGPGIPKDEHAKLFEPFFRGSAVGSQTGLGLAFAADVARKHGGSVTLVPSGSGTTFLLTLPGDRR